MTPLPNTSHLTDWELWACAKQQFDQHGKAAVEMATMRAVALLDAGDFAGHCTWLHILERIRHLQGPLPNEARH